MNSGFLIWPTSPLSQTSHSYSMAALTLGSAPSIIYQVFFSPSLAIYQCYLNKYKSNTVQPSPNLLASIISFCLVVYRKVPNECLSFLSSCGRNLLAYRLIRLLYYMQYNNLCKYSVFHVDGSADYILGECPAPIPAYICIQQNAVNLQKNVGSYYNSSLCTRPLMKLLKQSRLLIKTISKDQLSWLCWRLLN